MTNMDYKVIGYSGREYWQSHLNEMFKLVAPKDNWKKPIECVLNYNDLDFVALNDAIVHFTGGQATIQFIDKISIRVMSPGYYSEIGS